MGESQQSDVTIAAYLGFAKEKKKNQNKASYTAQISETITKNISREVEKEGERQCFQYSHIRNT